MSHPDFPEIYQICYRGVYRYAYTLTHNKSEAEDLTQEAFTRFLHTKDKFRQECKEQTWLCQTVRNLWINHQKGIKQTIPLGAFEISDPENLEDRISDRDIAQRIFDAALELPDPYREVFLLRILNELSFAQIGRSLKRSEGWARVVFYRAKLKVTETLEKGEVQND